MIFSATCLQFSELLSSEYLKFEILELCIYDVLTSIVNLSEYLRRILSMYFDFVYKLMRIRFRINELTSASHGVVMITKSHKHVPNCWNASKIILVLICILILFFRKQHNKFYFNN